MPARSSARSNEPSRSASAPPTCWTRSARFRRQTRYTVVFKLAYPAPLDAILASPYSAWIMSPGAADKDAAWFAAGNEAGTGPYRFVRYEPGQRLVVQRFDDYWGGWQPGQFDTVVFEMLDDNVAAEQMLRAGELDFANQIILTPDQMAGLDGTDGLRLDAAPSVGSWMVFLNHRRSPTDDVRVRQALAYSFPYSVGRRQHDAWQGNAGPRRRAHQCLGP